MLHVLPHFVVFDLDYTDGHLVLRVPLQGLDEPMPHAKEFSVLKGKGAEMPTSSSSPCLTHRHRFSGFRLEREFECNFISEVPGTDFSFFTGNSLLLAEFRVSLRG